MLAAVPSVWLVLWGSAVLAGRVSPDEGADGVTGPDGRHRVDGLPEDPGPISMALTLARLLGMGVSRLSLALPVPGDPLGLGGPAKFTTAAVARGEAVLVPERELGLLPAGAVASPGSDVAWQVTADVLAAPPGDGIGPAETMMRLALLEAAEELSGRSGGLPGGGLRGGSTGPDRPRPSAAPRRRLPPGTDGRAAHLLETADRMLDTVAAALRDDGGALTASQATHRRRALAPLERAARRAVVAACALAVTAPQPR